MENPELDLADAIRRRDAAAAKAKHFEEQGEGWAALDAWKEYELISAAIQAQERCLRASQRARAQRSAIG